ncbi:MAG: ATP-binding protein [Planctomycetota bacterium]
MQHQPRTEPSNVALEGDVTNAITNFTNVMETLQSSHRRLEEKARHVEAELCRTNDELAHKVGELDHVTKHLEAVLTAIPAGVVVYDPEGRIVRANDASLRILGVQRTDLLGAGAVAGLAGPFADGAPVEIPCGDGVVRVLARRYSPLMTEAGQPAGAVEVIEDQSELVRAHERLHRLDKTAALGTMAGGIAHEIRNPLHAIQGFAELLLREAEGDSRATRHAVRIKEGVTEIESIVASMLGITGDGALRTESFNVRAILREATEAALQERQAPALWTTEIVGPAASIRADRIKLRQALRNLIANACDAQPTGGAVRIELVPGAGFVEIVVSDDGPGVAPENVDRICDPFFTTRPEGTGMGLALVQRVAELHGGRLELRDALAPLSGASFALRVPEDPASEGLDAPAA